MKTDFAGCFLFFFLTTCVLCSACPAGEFLRSFFNVCEQCPKGRFSKTENAKDCDACPPGQYGRTSFRALVSFFTSMAHVIFFALFIAIVGSSWHRDHSQISVFHPTP